MRKFEFVCLNIMFKNCNAGLLSGNLNMIVCVICTFLISSAHTTHLGIVILSYFRGLFCCVLGLFNNIEKGSGGSSDSYIQSIERNSVPYGHSFFSSTIICQ